MIFNFITNEPDGLVLIDKQFFPEFNDALLYSFDIYLDVNGETELIYDFDEEWKIVRERESALIRDFINSGKLVVILSDKKAENCEMLMEEKKVVSDKILKVPSGKLILINASELIQALLYPESEVDEIIEMNEIMDFEVKKGVYSVEYNDIEKISLSYNKSIEGIVD
ncbi:MAG: hypothetical protein IKK33_04680 [Lachnospiraceae bacterium]|nr:hypothetical protein [Lachnospiraceae bacterium]